MVLGDYNTCIFFIFLQLNELLKQIKDIERISWILSLKNESQVNYFHDMQSYNTQSLNSCSIFFCKNIFFAKVHTVFMDLLITLLSCKMVS